MTFSILANGQNPAASIDWPDQRRMQMDWPAARQLHWEARPTLRALLERIGRNVYSVFELYTSYDWHSSCAWECFMCSGQANLSSLCRFNLVANFVQKFGSIHNAWSMEPFGQHKPLLWTSGYPSNASELKLLLTSSRRNHLAVTVGLLDETSHLQFNPAASGKPQWRRINSKRDLFTGHQCNQVTPSLVANHIASSSRARCRHRHRHRSPSEFCAGRSRHFDWVAGEKNRSI